MLGEQGVSPSTITTILLATLPYSFKFAISPPIKNLILRFQKYGMQIIRILAYITECIIIIGIALLGSHTKDSSYLLIFIHILIIVLSGAVHDLLGDYLRLSYFQGKLLGTATSLGTVGFRIGMLLASAGVLYMASFFGWQYAFVIISAIVSISVLSTILLKNEKLRLNIKNNNINSVKKYIRFCSELFKTHTIAIILLLTFSFKFSDSCINGLKTIFMNAKGFSKIDFANISQIMGITVIILVGILASSLTYKYSIKKCMRYTFICQIIPSICFIYLAMNDNISFITTAIILNIATFFLGFSAVVYRTYISELAKSDINTYTILLSIGSIFRSLSLYIGGYIVDIFSWHILYIVCLLSNSPGILVCFTKLKSKKQ